LLLGDKHPASLSLAIAGGVKFPPVTSQPTTGEGPLFEPLELIDHWQIDA